MKNKISLNELIAKSQAESPPQVDIADGVLKTLSLSGPAEVISYKPLAWIASASTAIAACLAAAAFAYIRFSASNSMEEVYNAISWVTQ